MIKLLGEVSLRTTAKQEPSRVASVLPLKKIGTHASTPGPGSVVLVHVQSMDVALD